jgi:hypothetical protein
MQEEFKPIRVRMKVMEFDGQNALLVTLMARDHTYEMVVHAAKQLSDLELHQLRLAIDQHYAPHMRVDHIEQ